MSGLALTQAPPPSVPMRFLASAPAWGVVAGAWLAWHGEAALASRWSPPTVVLVHLVALGVLGNGMLGALTQFLPVAAMSPFDHRRLFPLLHAAFNVGLVLFAYGMSGLHMTALHLAGCLLAGSLLVFAILAARALAKGAGTRWLRAAIGIALAGLVATAVLGVAAVLTLGGELRIALDRLVDTHAAFGTVGWTLALIVAVGSVTMPMLQGARSLPPRGVVAWLASVLVGLVAGAIARMQDDDAWLAMVVAAAAWVFAFASLWTQLRARHRRNHALIAAWTTGACVLAVAATMLLWWPQDDPLRAVRIGALALGIGLPMLVAAMLLEIAAFLAWIQLRRDVPRGRQVPGVGRLMPERAKRRVFGAHVVASAVLATAVWTQEGQAVAGVALALANATTLTTLYRCHGRMRRHAAELAPD